MTRNHWFVVFGLFLVVLGTSAPALQAKETRQLNKGKKSAANTPAPANLDFFGAMDTGEIKAKLIVMNDHEARLIITNNTKQPLNLKMPEAFAGVPIAAQFGGAGGGARGGGGGRTTGGVGGGAQQSVGGGGGGLGGGGLGGGGGGGGVFSIPPERTEKLDFAVLCLNHGLRDPSSSAPYKIVPSEDIERPAVVELLKAFGRGELKHSAAQAAAWHLNSDMSWQQLAAKLQGTRRSFSRPPYFSADDITAGMAYANAATRLAQANADEYEQVKKERAEKKAKSESSDSRSTTDTKSYEPAKTDAANDKDAVQSADEKKE